MSRAHHVAVLVALTGFAPAVARSGPPKVYTEEPPKEVKDLIDRVKGGEVAAIRFLGERDDAAPYLRRELKALAGADARRARDLAEALAPIEARVYQRNRKRFEGWVEQGRFDLCAELIVT